MYYIIITPRAEQTAHIHYSFGDIIMNGDKRTWEHTFAFIGAGNMASAFIFGLVDKGACNPGDIIIHRRDASKNGIYLSKGYHICEDYVRTFSTSKFIFLAVKPAQLQAVLQQLASSGADFSDSVFVSVCAAVSCDLICRWLGRKVPVVRVMPSTPITVGLGTCAVSHNEFVPKKDFQLICRMFSAVAEVSVIPEDMQNAVISVNGSSPAYFYLFVKAMLSAAEQQGISSTAALPLILKTMEGSAEMIRRSACSIDELIRAVSSPGGTTLAALKVFYDCGFEKTVADAMKACTDRADEIAGALECS